MEKEKGNPIGWFDIPVTDMGRAEKFYKEFLDFECIRQPEKDGVETSWFPMGPDTMTMYGAAGQLVKGPHMKPSLEGVLVYFSVASISGALARAKELGIHVLKSGIEIGENGHIASIEDSEGNRIALHSMML